MAARLYLVLFVFVTVFASVSFGKLPDYVKRCRKHDEQCMTDRAQGILKYLADNGGDTNFKLQDIRNFQVSRLQLAATKELPITLINTTFEGLQNTKITSISLDEQSNILTIKAHTPLMTIIGDYEMKGRILILPIEGAGRMRLELHDYDLVYVAKLHVEERKGKRYYRAENNPEATSLTFEHVGKMTFHFDDLFGGDPRLGPEMNKFLNENWGDIYQEVRAALQQAAAFNVYNPYVNGYLRRIPIEDLYDV